MYIYTVKRAFMTNSHIKYEIGQDISEKEYNELGENQLFVNKIWDGTQAELNEYNAKQLKKAKKAEPAQEEADTISQQEEIEEAEVKEEKPQKKGKKNK